MSLTADQILELPEDQRHLAIEKSIEKLSLSDIGKLSDALTASIEQDVRAIEGFANSQGAIQDRKKHSPKPKAVSQEIAEPIYTGAIPGTEQTEPSPAAEAPVAPKEPRPTRGGKERAAQPLQLSPDMRIEENLEVSHDDLDDVDEPPVFDLDVDPAERHGLPELTPEEDEDPRQGLIARMQASALQGNEAKLRAPKRTPKVGQGEKSSTKSFTDSFGTIQAKAMPYLWGLAGGWLATNELSSRLDSMQACVLGIFAGTFAALLLAKINKQAASMPMLTTMFLLSCLAQYHIGIPELAAGEFRDNAIIMGVCSIISGAALLIALLVKTKRRNA